MLLYRFTAQDAAGAWQPLCPPDPDGQRLGFPQPGPRGDIVIWCTAGALGKCVRVGYAPWRSLPDGTSLAPYHRACVNMMRADYCGDDRPTTRDGTLIDVYDRVGVNRRSRRATGSASRPPGASKARSASPGCGFPRTCRSGRRRGTCARGSPSRRRRAARRRRPPRSERRSSSTARAETQATGFWGLSGLAMIQPRMAARRRWTRSSAMWCDCFQRTRIREIVLLPR